jgi:Zn ribbon nucleic-acid-binding protein
MAQRLVECLNCGAPRKISALPSRPGALHECSRCGYVGWAETKSLTETLRRALRDRTLEQRRRVVAW